MENDDDDDETCPLCMQAFDETDLSFFSCPCNYQVCLFCVHYIMEQMNGKCPACRQEYKESEFRYDASRAKSFREKKNKRKADEKEQKREAEKSREEQEKELRARHAEQIKKRNEKSRNGKRDNEMRIAQRNVVHVLGLTASIAKAEVLGRPEFFGQYGKLLNIFIGKKPSYARANGHSSSLATFSAYLTFERNEEARVAIDAVDGFTVDGSVLRASLGTAKYEGEKSDRKDCNFLHKCVEEQPVREVRSHPEQKEQPAREVRQPEAQQKANPQSSTCDTGDSKHSRRQDKSSDNGSKGSSDASPSKQVVGQDGVHGKPRKSREKNNAQPPVGSPPKERKAGKADSPIQDMKANGKERNDCPKTPTSPAGSRCEKTSNSKNPKPASNFSEIQEDVDPPKASVIDSMEVTPARVPMEPPAFSPEKPPNPSESPQILDDLYLVTSQQDAPISFGALDVADTVPFLNSCSLLHPPGLPSSQPPLLSSPPGIDSVFGRVGLSGLVPTTPPPLGPPSMTASLLQPPPEKPPLVGSPHAAMKRSTVTVALETNSEELALSAQIERPSTLPPSAPPGIPTSPPLQPISQPPMQPPSRPPGHPPAQVPSSGATATLSSLHSPLQPPSQPPSLPPSMPPLQPPQLPASQPPSPAAVPPLLPPMKPPVQPPDVSNLCKDSALSLGVVQSHGFASGLAPSVSTSGGPPVGLSSPTLPSIAGLLGGPVGPPPPPAPGKLMESQVDHSKECLGLPFAGALGEPPRQSPAPPGGLFEALQRGAMPHAPDDSALPFHSALGLGIAGPLAPPLSSAVGSISLSSLQPSPSKMMSVAELEQRMVQDISGTGPSSSSTCNPHAAMTSGHGLLSASPSVDGKAPPPPGNQSQAMQNMLQKMFDQNLPPSVQREEVYGAHMPPLGMDSRGSYSSPGYPAFPFFGDPHSYMAGAHPYAGHLGFASSPAYGSAAYGGVLPPYGGALGGMPFNGSFPGASPSPASLYEALGLGSAHVKESSLEAERARQLAEFAKDFPRHLQGLGQHTYRENEIRAPSFEPR